MRIKVITNVLAVIFLATVCCSCSRSTMQGTNTNGSNTSSATHSDSASGSNPQNSPSAPATDSIKSIYTELDGKGCSAERSTSKLSSERTCSGIEGYKLLIQNDDERDSISVITPDGKEHPLNFWETISKGAFAYVGQKAEWRVASKNGKDVPIALIVRVEINSLESNKSGSYLAVSKISEPSICVTARIDPIANANEKAREAADSSANKPCFVDTKQD